MPRLPRAALNLGSYRATLAAYHTSSCSAGHLNQALPGIQRLANTIQHSKGPHYKCERSGEPEWLVCSSKQQVFANIRQDGFPALLGFVLAALRLE